MPASMAPYPALASSAFGREGLRRPVKGQSDTVRARSDTTFSSEMRTYFEVIPINNLVYEFWDELHMISLCGEPKILTDDMDRRCSRGCTLVGGVFDTDAKCGNDSSPHTSSSE